MDTKACFDELEKLGAVSDDQASAALDRLDTLERQKATAGQVARYGALGAGTGAAIGGIRNAIGGAKNNVRGAIGNAVAGAISAGALPVLQKHLDRKAEEHTLKKYISENDDVKEGAARGSLVKMPGLKPPTLTANPNKPAPQIKSPIQPSAPSMAPPKPRNSLEGARPQGGLPPVPVQSFRPPPMAPVPPTSPVKVAGGPGYDWGSGNIFRSTRRPRLKEKDSETDFIMHSSSDFKKAKLSFALQGHAEHQGMEIAIENKPGSVRKGTTEDGKKWRTVMKNAYGYIKGSKGSDGEEVDCYLGPDKDAPVAHVVHQHKPDGKGYDEDKVMLGFNSKEEAREAYLKHYDDPKFLGPMKAVPIERLKELVESGKVLTKISGLLSTTGKFTKPNALAGAGRSIAQVAKPVGFGRANAVPGANKGGI